MNKIQKIIFISAVVLLVVVAVIAGTARKKNPAATNTANNQLTQEQQAAAQNKTEAPAGQVVSGFPTELILNKDAQTNQSYAISYPLQNQYSAEVKTNDTVASTYQAYLNYFSKNGYQVINKNSQANIASIYALKSGDTVNVVASNYSFNGKQTLVEITYVKGSGK
ncbi:hypothetical protein KGQ24_00160 [Patescibacteria group bacterium]|nr:hypothetical protein [Patescibacteria group bacterium]